MAMTLLTFIIALPDPALARGYFDYSEVKSSNLQPFPKWTGVMNRYLSDLEPGCGGSYSTCQLKGWQRSLDNMRNLSLMEKVSSVNSLVNAMPYVLDNANWGVNDYWATPAEFQSRNAGDCEDYAISKYISLRSLGVPADQMRILILQDLNLGGIIHAVLMITVNGERYLLDNQFPQVVKAEQIYHYKPVYSINENAWWLHKM